MNNKPWYDDPHEMVKHVATLEGLRGLIEARQEAARRNELGRRENVLTNYIVNGFWYLDTYGQVSYLSEVVINNYRDRPVDLSELRNTPTVLTTEEFEAHLPKKTTYSRAMGGSVVFPPTNIPCAYCRNKWTIADSHECTSLRDQELIDLTLDGLVGTPLKNVLAEYASKTNAEYVGRKHALIRNARFIDLTLKDADKSWARPVNEQGWAADSRSKDRSDFPAIDVETYVIEEGDFLSLDVTHYYHPECKVKQLSVQHAFLTTEKRSTYLSYHRSL